MTLYYVRKTGNDSNAGTSTGAAWLTIDKAANTVAAGDTVYIGAGIYRELVTMDTAGSSGSLITYVGDVTGAYTGDTGDIIITAHASEDVAATRTACLDMNGKEFIVWKYVQFIGGTSFTVGNTSNASHIAYEGAKFENCLFEANGSVSAFKIEINNGATPTTAGLTIVGCRFLGQAVINWDSNGSSVYNLKWRIENCIFIPTINGYGLDMRRITNGGANTVGGISVIGCTFMLCAAAIFVSPFTNTTNVSYVRNCRFIYCIYAVDNTSGTLGAVTIYDCVASACTSTSFNVTWPPTSPTGSSFHLAGFHDFLHLYFYGWSYSPNAFTPIRNSIITDSAVDAGNPDAHTETTDASGQPRGMGRPSTRTIFYFDASDDAISDPNSVWTTESNIVDATLSTLGYSNSTGSSSSNYVFAGGTNAPSGSSTIVSVDMRAYAYHDSGTNNSTVTTYTDGLAESLGSVTVTNSGSLAYTSWSTLSTPSGGWTWTKVQALEFKAWKNSGSSYLNIGQIQIRVNVSAPGPDIGAVEANPLPVQNSTDQYEGTYCMELAGAGQFTFWQPVSAASTTITVRTKFDSNYTGTKPQLVATNIPGVADQTATATGSAGSYEQLSVNFTPTSAGFVRVILQSNDTGLGKCFFDDIRVS